MAQGEDCALGRPICPPNGGRFIAWAVAAWCLLSLLAILGDLGWTIWLLVRPRESSSMAELPGSSERYENASFEQLWERSAELARAGEFRAAIGVLLVALLHRLDALKVLHFHKSKTNGEYVREYPGEPRADANLCNSSPRSSAAFTAAPKWPDRLTIP